MFLEQNKQSSKKQKTIQANMNQPRSFVKFEIS